MKPNQSKTSRSKNRPSLSVLSSRIVTAVPFSFFMQKWSSSVDSFGLGRFSKNQHAQNDIGTSCLHFSSWNKFKILTAHSSMEAKSGFPGLWVVSRDTTYTYIYIYTIIYTYIFHEVLLNRIVHMGQLNVYIVLLEQIITSTAFQDAR